MFQQLNLGEVISEVDHAEELSDNPQKYDAVKTKLSRMAFDCDSMAASVDQLVSQSKYTTVPKNGSNIIKKIINLHVLVSCLSLYFP